MVVSYNKLWKKLIDLKMKKSHLRDTAGLSTNVMARLSKDETVSMDSLMKICEALHCDIGEILEIKNGYAETVEVETKGVESL